MKFVLNKCFGGFSVSEWAAEQLGLEFRYEAQYDDPRLIELVEKFPDKVSGGCAKLKVVEIPDNCTDYEINEYDGLESITYVVNGKIYHA